MATHELKTWPEHFGCECQHFTDGPHAERALAMAIAAEMPTAYGRDAGLDHRIQ